MTEVFRNNPAYRIFVENEDLGAELTARILRVEYDDTIEMASAITLTLDNHDFYFTDSKILDVGSELEVRMGYGRDLKFLGRAEIIRHLPEFAEDGASTLVVKAYDRSWRMMRQEMKITGSKKTPKKDAAESGRLHNGTLGWVLEDIVNPYGMKLIIQRELYKKEVTFSQRKGISDYQVCRSLANLHGADFYVTYVPGGPIQTSANLSLKDVIEPGTWTAVFGRKMKHRRVDPDKAVPAGTPLPGQQKVRYKFLYSSGELSTLLRIGLEYGIESTVSEMQVFIFDKKFGDYRLVSKEKTKGLPKKEIGIIPNLTLDERAPNIKSATQLKIAAAGYSVEVQANRLFRSAEDAAAYALAWFERNIDNFIIADGTLPGIETVRAGDSHFLGGFGTRFEGEYFFPNFTHVFDEAGYKTNFTARKIFERENDI